MTLKERMRCALFRNISRMELLVRLSRPTALALRVGKLSRWKSTKKTVCLSYERSNTSFSVRKSLLSTSQVQQPVPSPSHNSSTSKDTEVTSTSSDKAVDLGSPEQDAEKTPNAKFGDLLENSQFVKAMDPVGKQVEAEIIAVVEEKLYVDFGCKFHAVIPCPEPQNERYRRGEKVIITVKDLEVTEHFIGDSKHTSLLEAKAEFVRLVI